MRDLFAAALEPRGLRRTVASDRREHVGHVPDVVGDGDARPHLPVERRPRVGAEAAERLVDTPPHRHRGELDAALDRDAPEPVVDHAGRLALDPGAPERRLAVVVVMQRVLAEGRADAGRRVDAAPQRLVETRLDAVVVVQDVHPLAAGALDAQVEHVRVTRRLGGAVERDPAAGDRAEAPRHFGAAVAVAAVVDHFDLHVGCGLREHRCALRLRGCAGASAA